MGQPKDKDARKYSRVAKQRLEEAKLIYEKVELYALATYLSGYAVECMLKALLITATPPAERPPAGEETIEWLRKDYGHDLEALRRALRGRGAVMPPEVTREFLFVSTWNPVSRYEPGPGQPDEAEVFLKAAERIVRWADQRM